MSKLRDWLDECIKVKPITKNELAAEFGITPQYLHLILSGRRKAQFEILNKLADYFNRPRIEVYTAAGILEENESEMTRKFLDFLAEHPKYKRLNQILLEMQPEEREDMIETLLFVLEQRRGNDD